MKNYRLKQWYPSLPKEWKNQSGLVSFNADKNGYEMGGVEGVIWIIGSHEFKDEDFWELIEEKGPLFVTEDRVEVFSDIDNLFAINLTYFSKTQNTLRSSRWLIDNPSYKVFSLEYNADEYIWKNKPVFSYNDVMEFINLRLYTKETIEHDAKERSKE